jgi:metallo-beta-lactamase family protein
MYITFIGAAHEVTGSCTLLEVNGHNILVDCGMEQGRDTYENIPIPVPIPDLEAVLLTHAHIDHSGMIPWLVKNGFKGSVYATEVTCSLCDIMLKDSAHIQMQETEWRNRKALRSGAPMIEPVYTVEDAEAAMKYFIPQPYGRRVQILDGVDVRFTDIGHLLGSSSIEVWMTEGEVTKKIVFSGDIGNDNQPLLNDPKTTDSADYVMVESTYGNRLHEEMHPGYSFETQLTYCIQRTFDRGGNVVIPAFAVGRTQELLFFIRKIKAEKLIHGHEDFRVVIDSPLANEATGIFLQCDHSYFDEETKKILDKGVNPLWFPGLEVSVSPEESRAINSDPEPKVIISASGMCDAGRIRHHLKHNLWRKECLILFAGYQAEGTLGRALYDGAKEVRLFGEDIEVNAEIDFLANISGHADQKGLLRWIKGFTAQHPSQIFVNHGEEESCTEFAKLLVRNGYEAMPPASGTVFDLAAGQFVKVTKPVPIERQTKQDQENEESLYGLLMSAGRRLISLIPRMKNRPNKDIRRLTVDIDDIYKKWNDY